MNLRALALALMCSAPSYAQQPPPPAGRLVGLLQELSEDYDEAVEEHEEEEAERVEGLYADTLAAAKELPDAATWTAKVEALGKEIQAKAQPKLVSEHTARLINELVEAHHLPLAPAAMPDLKEAEAFFQSTCAMCHGKDGSGKTPIAPTLKPPPADLRSAEQMLPISPFRVFSAVSYGIPRTAMPAFAQLTEAQRWALAFYVFTLRQPACTRPAPKLSLEKLARSTDRQLQVELGPLAMPCVRRLQFKK